MTDSGVPLRVLSYNVHGQRDDTAALAGAIERVLTDADLRRELSEKGPPQAAKFTWDETARQTIAAYEDARAGSGGRGEEPAGRAGSAAGADAGDAG